MTGYVPSLDAPSWTAGALCAQVDPNLWFPEKGESSADALRVCARCEVRAECVDESLANREQFGVWGGMTQRSRLKALRAAARAVPVPVAVDVPDVLGGEAA